MALFDSLLAIDNALVDWILGASATTDEERAQMMRVLALRGDLDLLLNRLVGYRLKLAVANLADESAKVDQAATDMKNVAKTIDTVQEVVTIAGTAVEIGAKALTFASGAL